MTAILKSVYCSCRLTWSISQTLKVATPVQFERAWFGVQEIAQTRLDVELVRTLNFCFIFVLVVI